MAFLMAYFTQPKLVVYSFFSESSILLRGEQIEKECAREGNLLPFSLRLLRGKMEDVGA